MRRRGNLLTRGERVGDCNPTAIDCSVNFSCTAVLQEECSRRAEGVSLSSAQQLALSLQPSTYRARVTGSSTHLDKGPVDPPSGIVMASWARVAGACATATRSLLRQDSQLARSALQSSPQARGFASGAFTTARASNALTTSPGRQRHGVAAQHTLRPASE